MTDEVPTAAKDPSADAISDEPPVDEHAERMRRHAELLDASFGIPGTPWKWGLDSIVGLIPGVGDAAGAGLALWIPYQAWRGGASARAVAAMCLNVVIDVLLGTIPVLGDVFDIWFKASERNMAIYERDREQQGATKPKPP